MKKHAQIIGIDEVGRGPLAGPVAVGAVCIHREHYKKVAALFPVIKDSKKLTEKIREKWCERILEAEQRGFLMSAVSFISPSIIDKNGLTYSIRTALGRALTSLGNETPKLGEVLVLLDGGLKAPEEYLNQETIIKGDEKELAIALASIVAKVARDKRMILLSKKFPEYGFEKHKGYGTKAHYAAIQKHGITPHHRKRFLKVLFLKSK